MLIHYLPTDKIVIDGIELTFGEDREVIRNKIGEDYKGDDKDIDLENIVIQVRRDIYENIMSSDNYIFLHYTVDNKLKEVSVHHCDQIMVFDILLDFDQHIDSIAEKLIPHSVDWKEKDGSYFFKDLKMVISDQYATGGEGKELSHFYCSSDVSHLRDLFV